MVGFMKTMKTARRMLAVACAVVVASFAFAGSAFAATVHGADYQGSGSILESGNVDVLNVDGHAGETVFLTVYNNGKKIAQNLPYTIGEGADAGDAATWAGVATLDISGFDVNDFNGAYTIEARDSRAGGTALYNGTIYGVYADIEGGPSKLIGTRTVNDAEKAVRTFTPPDMVFVNGKTYRLKGEAQGDGALHFAYEAYDEATKVDGVIKFLDAGGNVVAKNEYPGLAYGEEKTLKMGEDVPNVVVADNGDLYRVVFFGDKIVLRNPGAVSYSIYCTKISDADKALAGYFVATINLVDESGAVIASDSVNVTGDFVYTAPSTIYKKESVTAIGQPAVVTYTIEGTPVLYLSAADNASGERAKTFNVKYSKQDPDQPTVDVTYNLIDGSKRVGEKGRSLGTQSVTVTLDSPTATPEATIDVEGATYNLVGDPSEYEYTIRSGEVPSINAYYVPEGYQPPGPYEVTVNYVNYLTDQVVESHTYTSDPNATGALVIETPASFESGGVEYIRLDGQEADIEHSYYSGIASYTVYYRDKNDTLSSGTVINTIRVVYRDGGATGTTGATATGAATAGTANTAGAAGTAGGDAAAGGAGAADANGAAAGEGAQNLQLNDGRTYNVFGGDGGNGTMTNESGVDSNTERIEDSETPLASGFDKGGTSTAASAFSGAASWMLPAGIGLAVVIAIAAGLMAIRRRKLEEADEA